MYKEIFYRNQACLVMIPEIVSLLREQRFYGGNQRIRELINGLTVISDYVVSGKKDHFDTQKWLIILQAVLDAQKNKDYIMLADLLQGDLLPYLEDVQNYLLEDNGIVINEYWKENLESIKLINPCLYDAILKDSVDSTKESQQIHYEPMLAINGQPTLKAGMDDKVFCMHSTINPEWEAKSLAKGWIKTQGAEYQIFGMGMGYHIKALLDENKNIKVSVLEYKIEPLVLALTYLDWQKYLMEGRLNIIYESDIMQLLKRLRRDDEEKVFFLHYPSLQCVEQNEVKEILEDYFISVSSMQEQGEYLKQNFEYLQKQNFLECSSLREIFANKNVVIVAGGPSVDNELENLKKYRGDLVILSVGTAARKLIEAGIRPDAIIVTDPQDTMYRQVEGLKTEEIPLMLLSTASKSIVSHYDGPIYLVYQYGFEQAEKVAKECGYPLFQTGGSVTTTALDVSIGLGAKTIILVGTDMGFTDNRSHAGGIGRDINDVLELRKVSAVGGGFVYTSRNLDIYRKWIERRISNLKEPVIYNTSRGARISGTVEANLEDII